MSKNKIKNGGNFTVAQLALACTANRMCASVFGLGHAPEIFFAFCQRFTAIFHDSLFFEADVGRVFSFAI